MLFLDHWNYSDLVRRFRFDFNAVDESINVVIFYSNNAQMFIVNEIHGTHLNDFWIKYI